MEVIRNIPFFLYYYILCLEHLLWLIVQIIYNQIQVLIMHCQELIIILEEKSKMLSILIRMLIRLINRNRKKVLCWLYSKAFLICQSNHLILNLITNSSCTIIKSFRHLSKIVILVNVHFRVCLKAVILKLLVLKKQLVVYNSWKKHSNKMLNKVIELINRIFAKWL